MDGWVGAAPELWLPKSEGPAAALARPDAIKTQSEGRSSQSIHQRFLPLKESKGKNDSLGMKKDILQQPEKR